MIHQPLPLPVILPIVSIKQRWRHALAHSERDVQARLHLQRRQQSACVILDCLAAHPQQRCYRHRILSVCQQQRHLPILPGQAPPAQADVRLPALRPDAVRRVAVPAVESEERRVGKEY